MQLNRSIRQRALLGLAGVALAVTTAATPVSADYGSGSFNTDDGPACTWAGSSYGGSGFYNVDCSGYSRSRRAYVSYSCDWTTYGSGSSWSCRDRSGNRWSGSK